MGNRWSEGWGGSVGEWMGKQELGSCPWDARTVPAAVGAFGLSERRKPAPRTARAPQRWSFSRRHFSKNAKSSSEAFRDGAWKISRTEGRRCVLFGSILDIVVLDRQEVAQGKIIFHRYV